MSSLTICSQNINVVDNFYSLNDLHKASGSMQKHKPFNFMRNEETKELIREIESENLIAVKVVKGGNVANVKQGTYVCKELVYRYAMWISAKFSLIVIRAFDNMVSRSDSQQREILVKACSKLAIGNMLISDVYLMVGKQFGHEGGIKDIPTPLLPEATAFVYEMILRLKPSQTQNSELTEKMASLGMAKGKQTYEMLDKIQKAIGDLDYFIGEVRKNTSVQNSAFKSIEHQIPNMIA